MGCRDSKQPERAPITVSETKPSAALSDPLKAANKTTGPTETVVQTIVSSLEDTNIGYLRLHHTDLYLSVNDYVVADDAAFWSQSCFGGVIVCKHKTDSEPVSIWKLQKQIGSDNEYKIMTRIHRNKDEYLRIFGTEWCHVQITGNPGLDKSCGLHYHGNAIGYFRIIPHEQNCKASKQSMEDALLSFVNDQPELAQIIVAYLDFTKSFTFQLVRSAADRMAIGCFPSVSIPKRETSTTANIPYDMHRANGPILDATDAKQNAAYFVLESV